MQFDVDGLRLHYEVFGEGHPILFIHGLGLDHRSLSEFVEPILDGKRWKRIYIDLPGMGNSEYAEWLTSSDKVLEIVSKFIEFIFNGDSFLLAGYSYGGYLALGLLHKNKYKVDGLFLLCPVVVAEHAKRSLPEHNPLIIEEDFLKSLNVQDRAEFSSISIIQTRNMWEKYKRIIDVGHKTALSEFVVNFPATPGYAFSFEKEMLEGEYNLPALVVTAVQDSVVGIKDSWNIMEAFPRSSYAALDLCGHSPQIEKENILSQLFYDWLERVLLELI